VIFTRLEIYTNK